MQNTQFVENVQVMSNLISANIHGHESREVKQVVDKCYRESLDHIIRSAIRWEPQQVMSWLNKGVQLRERREGLYWVSGFKYVQMAADELKVMLKHTHGRSHEELVAKMLEDMGMWHLIGSEPHLLNTSAVAETCALWQERGWSRNLPNPTQVVQSHEVDQPANADELDPDPEHHCVADRPNWICTCPDCMPEE